MDRVDGEKLVPFVKLFNDNRSICIWEDEVGRCSQRVPRRRWQTRRPSDAQLFSLGTTRRWWQFKLRSLKVNDCLHFWTTLTSSVRRPG